MTRRLALFDCDGTLVDGQHAICAAMDAAFSAHALAPPDHHRVRRIVGLSLPQAVASLSPALTPDRRDAVVAAYKQAYGDLRASGHIGDEPLYDGIVAVLDTLAEHGWALGVATGKSDRGLARVLAAHGIADRFVTLQTADRHPSKPHPAMADAAMTEAGATPAATIVIGDTSFDMVMAAAAGARAIGVDWGYHDADELRGAGAHGIAAVPADLLRLMEAM